MLPPFLPFFLLLLNMCMKYFNEHLTDPEAELLRFSSKSHSWYVAESEFEFKLPLGVEYLCNSPSPPPLLLQTEPQTTRRLTQRVSALVNKFPQVGLVAQSVFACKADVPQPL